MTIKIIQLKTNLYPTWLELWQAYQLFYQVNLTDEVNQNTWDKLTNLKYANVYGFAAFIEEEMVGIVHVIEHESCWTLQPYAYLQDLYTSTHARGKGVARALIQKVYEVAQSRHCDRVYWLTHQNNETAQHLYDKVARRTGFIQYRMN